MKKILLIKFHFLVIKFCVSMMCVRIYTFFLMVKKNFCVFLNPFYFLKVFKKSLNDQAKNCRRNSSFHDKTSQFDRIQLFCEINYTNSFWMKCIILLYISHNGQYWNVKKKDSIELYDLNWAIHIPSFFLISMFTINTAYTHTHLYMDGWEFINLVSQNLMISAKYPAEFRIAIFIHSLSLYFFLYLYFLCIIETDEKKSFQIE